MVAHTNTVHYVVLTSYQVNDVIDNLKSCVALDLDWQVKPLQTTVVVHSSKAKMSGWTMHSDDVYCQMTQQV